jgi:hypothetical protein
LLDTRAFSRLRSNFVAVSLRVNGIQQCSIAAESVQPGIASTSASPVARMNYSKVVVRFTRYDGLTNNVTAEFSRDQRVLYFSQARRVGIKKLFTAKGPWLNELDGGELPRLH